MARRILVVDDNAMNREVLKHALSTDYDLVEAANGQEAIEIIEQSYKTLSAVLLDIQMPIMDGYEVLRRMRENPKLAQLTVIVVTGSEDEASRVKALECGANDFITKPFNPEIVRHCLRNNIALRETESIVNAIQKDKLTGIYNREFFFEKAEEMIKAHEPGYYIIACLDIDHFKLVNEQYGTAEGDRVLKHIGAALKETFEHVNGLCGRISGDNFASLFPNCPEVVSYVTEGHGERYLPKDAPASLFVSVGRYVVTDCSLSASALYDRAYIAKRSVKGRYDKHIAYFDDSMLESLVKEQQIAGDMDAAIAKRQFEVWFQPQYNHANGALIGAEALVRWRHPEKGMISPGAFIPVFEQNGFIYELDKYVWENTCRYLRKWLDEGRKPLPVSVNISRYDIFKPDLIETLTELIERYGIPVELLRLEITESAFSKSAMQIIAVVQRLLEEGFTVEIDDFGSGYSSLNTLKDVPAQIIKLDMRFLEDSENSQRGGNILESIVRMAKWLGMAIIAEGVETIEQADFLKSIGCSYIQGYLYARPMPAEEYEALAKGVKKEQQLIVLETVENMDNNVFWDPQSMDTLIFNSYVGGACIYEYHGGAIEPLRANEKFVNLLGGDGITIESTLKMDWMKYFSPESVEAIKRDLQRAIETKDEVTNEYLLLNLPGCSPQTYLKSIIRVIASVGDRFLIYCMNENVTALRLAEEKARETTSQLQAIMDDIDGGITAAVIDDGETRFLLSNDRYYEIIGYTRAQFDAEIKDPFDPIHPEDRAPAVILAREVLKSGKPKSAELRIVRRDGSLRWVWVQLSLTRFVGVAQEVQLCVYSDITAEKEMQRRLRETDAQLKLLADNIPGGIATYACKPGGFTREHIRITYFNDGFCTLFGFSREEYEKKCAADPMNLVFEQDAPALNAQIAAMIENGTPVDCQYRVHLKNGGYKWIRHKAVATERQGDTVIVNAMLLDVTERQEAVEKLRISAEEYRLALQHSGNMISRFNFADHSVTIEPEMAARYGMPERIEDVPYGPIRRGDISPESQMAFVDFFEEIIHGHINGKGLYQYKMPNGWRWQQAYYSTVFADSGEPVFAVLSYFDVTEQQEKEKVYKKWLQSLREKKPEAYTLLRCNLNRDDSFETVEGELLEVGTLKEKMGFDERMKSYALECVYEEDRDRFLTAIGSKALLANYYRDIRSESLEYREKMKTGGVRWLRLGVDLMQYPNSTEMEVHLMFEDIDESKREELQTIERAETDPLTGVLNRTAFAANVEHLIHTAKPHTLHALLMMDVDGFKLVNDSLGHDVGDQTLIDIASSLRGMLRRDDLVGRLGGDEFLVLLRDIPSDAIAVNKAKQICALTRRTFNMDVQISASVGIAIWPRDGQNFEELYKKADDAMYHIKDMGKDNYMLYRDNMEDDIQPGENEEVNLLSSVRKRRILVVDDNLIDRAMLVNIFKDDYNVEKAKDGASALIRLRHYGSAVSAVLLDLMMPGMDGFTVLDRMQSSAELRAIPVIVVSGMGEHSTSLKALKCGAADFVTKPVDPDALRVRVQSAISRAENERVRALNSLLELQNREAVRYKKALRSNGILVIEHDWINGKFIYDPAATDCLAGTFDERSLWRILLSDLVADTPTVKQVQELVHELAGDRSRTEGSMRLQLRTRDKDMQWFHLIANKLTNEFGLTDKIIITLRELGTDTTAE